MASALVTSSRVVDCGIGVLRGGDRDVWILRCELRLRLRERGFGLLSRET